MSILENLKPYFFEVELCDFKDLTGKDAFKPVAVYRKDQNKILHLASKDYRLITNQTLLKPIIESLESKNYDIKSQTYVEGEKYYFYLNIHSKSFILDTDNSIIPSIEINNSYDGTLMATVALGFHHLDSNMPLLGLSNPFLNHKKHREELFNETLFSYEVILMYIEYFLSQKTKFNFLFETYIEDQEKIALVKKIIKKSGLPALFTQVILNQIQDKNKPSNRPWDIYFAFNSLLNQNPLKMPMHQKHRIMKHVLNELKSRNT
jgi:hypothetical protein